MRKMGLKVTIYSKRNHSYYRSCRGKVGKTAPNLLKQTFNETVPYHVMHTDISQIPLFHSKVRAYISPVIDEASGQLITFAVSNHPDEDLIDKTLSQLFRRLPSGIKPILHSDQGWHYQLPYYQNQLRQHHIIQSMSRKGNCLDNSPVESFFSLLKRECLNRVKITSIHQLQTIIDHYQTWYNQERISLKKME